MTRWLTTIVCLLLAGVAAATVPPVDATEGATGGFDITVTASDGSEIPDDDNEGLELWLF